MLSDVLRRHFKVYVKNPHQIHKMGSRLRKIPCILFAHDWRGVSGALETMELELGKSRFYGRRIVLLVRDPRDVVVSNYFQKRYREHSFEGTMHDFIHDPVRGIKSIIDYYNIWAKERAHMRGFAIVRYEDLRIDPTTQVSRILDYCGVHDVPSSLIEEIVELYEFRNMQKMEREGRFNSRSVTPGEKDNPDSFKARAGKVGGYIDHLEDIDRRYVDRIVSDRLDPYFAAYHGR